MKALRNAIIFAVFMLTIWMIMSFVDARPGDDVQAGMILTALRTLAIVVITVVCMLSWAITHHIESLKKEMKAERMK